MLTKDIFKALVTEIRSGAFHISETLDPLLRAIQQLHTFIDFPIKRELIRLREYDI